MFILKGITGTANWQVYHDALGNTYNTQLNSTSASNSGANWWGSTSPSSTVCTVGADLIETGQDAIAYCFAEKTGYSKFGSYTGNGNADGTFVYTGFKPTFLLVKKYNASGQSWYIYDAIRDGENQNDGASGCNRSLRPNTNEAEEQASGYAMDILSNGFKWRMTSNQQNGDTDTYIYMAIGQSLVGSNNIPCTAR